MRFIKQFFRPVQLLCLLAAGAAMLSGCIPPEEMLRNPLDESVVRSEVVIGAALPLTGNHAEAGKEMLMGAKIAVRMLNSGRGIAGRRVRLEVADTQSTPSGARRAMRQLAEKGASAAVGGYSTTETSGLAAAANTERLPLAIACATADKFSQAGPFVFRVSCTDTQQAQGLAAYLWYWRQIKAIAVLIDMRSSSEYERNIARSVAQSFADLGGNVVKTAEYTDVDSCVAAMRKVMGFGPQAIMVPAAGKEAAKMITALRKLGFTGVICGADGWDDPEFFTTLGKEINPGECFFVSCFSSEYKDDEYSVFAERFRKEFFHYPNSRQTSVYDAVMMLGRCLGNISNIRQFRTNWLALQNYFGACSVYNPLRSGDVDRMIFLNSISPAGTAGEYPAARLIRNFMHSKLEGYLFE